MIFDKKNTATTHQLILYIYGSLNKKLQHVVGKLRSAEVPDILDFDTLFEIGCSGQPVVEW